MSQVGHGGFKAVFLYLFLSFNAEYAIKFWYTFTCWPTNFDFFNDYDYSNYYNYYFNKRGSFYF